MKLPILKILMASCLWFFSFSGAMGQSLKHSLSVGINHSWHRISDDGNMNLNNIHGKTSVVVSNKFSFQSKPLTNRSFFPFDFLSKLDISYNRYWFFKNRMQIGTGIMGSGRNFVVTEFPLSRSSGQPLETPANRVYKRYYVVSVPLQFKFNYSSSFHFKAGVNVNIPLMRPVENAFYQTKPKNAMYPTLMVGLETKIGGVYHAYLDFNKGLVRAFNDNISVYSPLAFGHEPIHAKVFSYGDVLQFGITKYLNKTKTSTKLKESFLSKFKETTFVSKSSVQIMLWNENRDTSYVDVYVNNQLMNYNVLIDSGIYSVDLHLEKNKTYVLKWVTQQDTDVKTNISIVEDKFITNKYIWKPQTEKTFITRLKLKD